jgi:hypothetical protein
MIEVLGPDRRRSSEIGCRPSLHDSLARSEVDRMSGKVSGSVCNRMVVITGEMLLAGCLHDRYLSQNVEILAVTTLDKSQKCG